MGYFLNRLSNLPVDDEVTHYCFILREAWDEPYIKLLMDNFQNIARSIGNNGVIATGLDPDVFLDDVATAYLGDEWQSYTRLFPALLITDAHPEQVTEASERLFVPLKDMEKRFGGTAYFFNLLARYIKDGGGDFKSKFEAKEGAFDTLNEVFNLKPGMFGFSINLNKLFAAGREAYKASSLPYVPPGY